MNKGYVADLDALNMTPARKVQSFPSVDVSTANLTLFYWFLSSIILIHVLFFFIGFTLWVITPF